MDEQRGRRSRGNGEGSIYQRESDGRWCCSVTRPSGKRQVLYGKTRAEVAKKLNVVLQAREQGIPTPPQGLTISKLLGEWLERDVKQRPLTRTQESYEFLIRVHVNPAPGRKRVIDLTVRDVEDFLRAKAREDSKLGRPYAASTLRSLRAVLSGALTYGQRLDLVHRNVARLARIPMVELSKKRTAMTPDLARIFLGKIQGHRLEALYSVAMAIGLRQAETLGLRWSDVDLDAGRIHVRVQLARIDGVNRLNPPKRHQLRTIPLPETAVSALREHRKRQVEERLLAGARWEDWDLVFPSRYGTPLNRHNVSHRFKELLARLGLPELVFHELRHTCASLLLAQGVHPRAVMEILGHSQLSTTTDVYSHVGTELLAEAARQMDAALTATR
jgi:integrase